MRRKVLLLAALGALSACGPAVGQEAPQYAMLAGPDGALWVVDGAGSRVARCREAALAAPRVIDVAQGQATARPRGGAGEEPVCTGWVAIAAPTSGMRPKIVGAGG